jgi:hypothetical protein
MPPLDYDPSAYKLYIWVVEPEPLEPQEGEEE